MEQFKVKIDFVIYDDNGNDKNSSEIVLFEDAVNFTDAETRSFELIEKNNMRVAEIATIAKTFYERIDIVEGIEDDTDEASFYEVVVKENHETESGRIKVQTVKYLVAAKSVTSVEYFVEKEIYDETLLDYKIFAVKNSKIVEVLNKEI